MTDRFADYDAACAEIENSLGPPPSMTLGGDTVTLPYSLPAKVVLFQARNRHRLVRQDADGNSLPPEPEAAYEFACLLFGTEQVDVWVDRGLAHWKLWGGTVTAIHLISGKRSDEGEAQPPEAGGSSTTSSPDGSPSKATSPGSTDGT